MSILSTILGWFTPTPKQETPAAPAVPETSAQRTNRIAARVKTVTAKANAIAMQHAAAAAAMQREQIISDLEARMAERRIRLAGTTVAAAKAERHLARLELCDQQEATLDDFDVGNYEAAAKAAKAAPILAAYREELEALTAEDILAGESDTLDSSMRAMRKMVGLV
jgi:hypothetical protein